MRDAFLLLDVTGTDLNGSTIVSSRYDLKP